MEITKVANYFEIKYAQDMDTKIKIADVKRELESFTGSTYAFFKACNLDEKTKSVYIDTLNRFKSAGQVQLDRFQKERKKAELDYVYNNLNIIYNWFKSPEMFKGMPAEVIRTLKSGIANSFTNIVTKLRELYSLVK